MPDENTQTIGETVLAGIASKDRKERDSYEPRRVEVTPDGRLKTSFPGDGHQLRLTSGVLGATDTVIFTSKSDYKDVNLIIANVDSSARTYQIHHIPSGGSADDTSALAKVRPLAIGDVDVIRGLSLSSGEVISGLCDSASKVNVTIYGTPR